MDSWILNEIQALCDTVSLIPRFQSVSYASIPQISSQSDGFFSKIQDSDIVTTTEE